MRQHDPGVGRDQPHAADHAALDAARPRVRPVAERGLLVQVQRGLVIGDQVLPGQPLAKEYRCVAVFLAWASGYWPWQDKPDHVVRVGRHQLVLVVSEDAVVRWRSDIRE